MRRRRKFSDREDPRRNRGEIACRIMRTAKLVGIGTVAVYSDVDRGSLHVKSADEVVRIGPPLARSSYLNASAIIDAVIRTGAQGIRIVHGPNEFVESAMGAQREAAASFGVNTILLEKYITRPRHIEVQVFGDKHGNVLHLYEHDCSVQRRRQKIIEEAPAPNVTNEFRRLIGEAAVSAAKVEHPVTEMIIGQDLVEWQIHVANGEPLPLTQSEVPFLGHAFEARIYSENVPKGFLPASGDLHHYCPVPVSPTV